jgi:hypothetical protein
MLAAKVAPRDPDLKRKLAACEKESQRQRFEKALRYGLFPHCCACEAAQKIRLCEDMRQDTIYPGFTGKY